MKLNFVKYDQDLMSKGLNIPKLKLNEFNVMVSYLCLFYIDIDTHIIPVVGFFYDRQKGDGIQIGFNYEFFNHNQNVKIINFAEIPQFDEALFEYD